MVYCTVVCFISLFVSHSKTILEWFIVSLNVKGFHCCIFAVLNVCWTNQIRRFAFHFKDSVRIDPSDSSDVAQHIRSCANVNDTLFYSTSKRANTEHSILIEVPNISSQPLEFRQVLFLFRFVFKPICKIFSRTSCHMLKLFCYM